jgi:hypothetical protein
MKKILLFSVMILFCFFLKGQDIKSDTTKQYVYCELVGMSGLTGKVNVSIDFGEKRSFLQGASWLKGEDGKLIKFNSMIDALNYMGKDKWEFVQAYAIGGQGGSVYHFLLKKQTSLLENEK